MYHNVFPSRKPPLSGIVEPMTLRWGILGTGNIARQFANGVRQSESGVLAAVGSRSIDSARAFAGQFQVPTAHGDYDALLADRDCDAIYVSLPNTMHHAWAIKALRAGKHVLCEKPISVTAAEAEEMFDVAHTHSRVLVEAFMYRAHPQTLAVVEAVRSGAIGRIKLIRTSFCYRTKKIDGNIRFDRTLAGGAMMDIGCYCLSFARLIAGGEPVEAKIVGAELVNGVDVLVSGSLKFPGGVLSSFTCGMNTQADNSANICGEEGWITIPVPWKPPAGGGTFTIERQTPPKQDGATAVRPPIEKIDIPEARDVYAIEADAFADVVRGARAPFVSAADSIGNMKLLENLSRSLI